MAAKYQGPAEKLELYEALVATLPGVKRRGAANPYTSLNGWMTSFLDKEGEASIRLPKEDRSNFIDTYDSRISVQYGSQMKEFVVMPDWMLADLEEAAPWFARSYKWVGTLEPKPTKKSG